MQLLKNCVNDLSFLKIKNINLMLLEIIDNKDIIINFAFKIIYLSYNGNFQNRMYEPFFYFLVRLRN